MPRQYHVYVGGQPVEWDFDFETEKLIYLSDCNISADGIKILYDVQVLFVSGCIVDLCEHNALFSWFTPVPHSIFSALSRITIWNCKNMKKLFLSN